MDPGESGLSLPRSWLCKSHLDLTLQMGIFDMAENGAFISQAPNNYSGEKQCFPPALIRKSLE